MQADELVKSQAVMGQGANREIKIISKLHMEKFGLILQYRLTDEIFLTADYMLIG